MTGFLLIDKPEGITSHDVIYHIRKLTGEKRVGHAGTLDPFATGLLIVGVGREATREMEHLVGLDKEYEAEFVLGARSNTDDKTGNITLRQPPATLRSVGASWWCPRSLWRRGIVPPGKGDVLEQMKNLTGTIQQIPPQYAAIKVKGKKMYELARKGKEVRAEPREMTVHAFELLDGPVLRGGSCVIRVRIRCSSGTYIRALARDMDGYALHLRRTKIGPFDLSESQTLETLKNKGVQPFLLPIGPLLARVEG